MEKETKTSTKRIVAKILINIKVKGGMCNTIDFVWGNKRHTQVIDYLNLPFRCVTCHRVGHVFMDCEHSQLKQKWVPKKKPIRGFGLSQEMLRQASQFHIRRDPCGLSLPFGGLLGSRWKRGSLG